MVPRTSDYIKLQGRRELKLQVGLRLLLSGPCCGRSLLWEIILDDLGQPNVITRALIKWKREAEERSQSDGSSRRT